MPIYAPSPVTPTPWSGSLDEPLQEQPKASTSTSEHDMAVENENVENVIKTLNPNLAGLYLADSQEKQAGEDSLSSPATSQPPSGSSNLRQTHLGYRPGSEVNEASNGKVHSSGNKATLGIMEIVDKLFGGGPIFSDRFRKPSLRWAKHEVTGINR